MSTKQRADLKKIRTFPALISYLRDEMGWPIESTDFDELTFDYTPEELGIDSANAAKIQEIKHPMYATTIGLILKGFQDYELRKAEFEKMRQTMPAPVATQAVAEPVGASTKPDLQKQRIEKMANKNGALKSFTTRIMA